MISFPISIRRRFAQLSFRFKLALGFVCLVALLGALLLLSLFGAHRIANAVNLMQQVEFPIEENVFEIRDAIQEARRYEKEYLLQWKELGVAEARTRYVNLFRLQLDRLPEKLSNIDRLVGAQADMQALSAEIASHAKQYQKEFLATVALIEQLGDSKNGAIVELDTSAQRLSVAASKQAPMLAIALLQVRMDEYQFLMLDQKSEMTRFLQTEKNFEDQLAHSNVSSSVRQQLQALSQAYREKFLSYAELVSKILQQRHRYLRTASQIAAPLKALEERTDERLKAIETWVPALQNEQFNHLVVFGSLMLMLGTLMAYLLWLHVGASVDELIVFSEKIAHGEYSSRLLPREKGQFGRLVIALNKMTDGILHTQFELEQVNAELERRVTQRTKQIRAANRGLVERTEEMAYLAELTEGLLDIENSQDAYRMLSIFFRQILPKSVGQLYLRMDDTGAYIRQAAWGEHEHMSVSKHATDFIHVDDGLRFYSSQKPGYAAVVAPIFAHGQTFGLLHLELPATGGVSGKEMDPADKILVEVISKQLAMGINNLRLREGLREQAVRDILSGLYNRRYLDETLVREIERTRRNQSTMTVIMLDVDHFKRFNDDYGHEAGDVVLAEIGRLLRENVRSSDVACRYGGEEFTILLIDSDLKLATERAEMIRLGAHSMECRYQGIHLPRVSLSLGVAQFPLHGDSSAALLAAADAALYRAKHAGRDQTVIAQLTSDTESENS